MDKIVSKKMMIKLHNAQSIEINAPSTIKEIADQLKLTEPHQAIGALVNGEPKDLSYTVLAEDELKLLSFDDPQGREIYWHSSSHVLAQAVLRLFPEAKPTIGPPIQEGFYYDFANLNISESDFPAIESEAKKILKENYKTQVHSFSSKTEALIQFKDNPYKEELINSFDEDSIITGYKQGEFFDLCRGPHIFSLGKIKAFKILKTSGAYWRGNSDNEMLTRIYGISFPSKDLLKDYLQRLEEAQKRDHKVIGPKLGLFSLKEEASGMPFIHPKGMIVWNQLMSYWRHIHTQAKYVEIKTPIIMTRQLWERSGHWDNYKENMYTTTIDKREFVIKPMNCPGNILFYQSEPHSYKELPYRIAEIGTVHRHEPSGSLSGLLRVRSFHQDDAHIFMKPEDITEEILNVLSLVDEMYTSFGLTYHLELSTRPESKTIGTDKDWELTTASLQKALDTLDKEYRINEGDGAFYGPKIDMHIQDAIGRTWQCGTIQLDMSLPEKFNLEYIDNQGNKQRPIMIHRVIYGSIERFFAILIEHFCGKFPLWLSPMQIGLINVADRHIDYCEQLKDRFSDQGFHCSLDSANESVSKKIRRAQMNQINYILTIGDNETSNQTASLRTRDNRVHGEIDINDFIDKIFQERLHKDLHSPYSL